VFVTYKGCDSNLEVKCYIKHYPSTNGLIVAVSFVATFKF